MAKKTSKQYDLEALERKLKRDDFFENLENEIQAKGLPVKEKLRRLKAKIDEIRK